MRKLLSLSFGLFLAISGIGLGSASAQAAVIWNWDGATLTGAQNVDVNGTLYNVTFVEGTCQALFSGCDSPSDFAFSTSVDAQAAAQALLDQVFVDPVAMGAPPSGPVDPSSPANFDTDPLLTFGCSETKCLARVPWDKSVATAVGYWYAHNTAVEPSDLVLNANVLIGTDSTSSNTQEVWAQFTVVPVPPALVLFVSSLVALFGVGRVGRRRQSKAAA